MTDPEIDDLSPVSRALVELERGRSDAPTEAMDAVLARLEKTLGLPPVAPKPDTQGAGTPPRSGPGLAVPAAAMSHGAAGKVVAGSLLFVLGGFAGAGIVVATGSPAHLFAPSALAGARTAGATVAPNAEPREEPRAGLNANPDSAPLTAQGAAPSPAAAPAGGSTGPTAGSPGRPSPLVDGARPLRAERMIIETARSALSQGHTSDALAALGRHEALFPQGQLAEEREALAVQCLAASGAGELARKRADRFRRQFPRSMLSPAVDAAIEPAP